MINKEINLIGDKILINNKNNSLHKLEKQRIALYIVDYYYYYYYAGRRILFSVNIF